MLRWDNPFCLHELVSGEKRKDLDGKPDYLPTL